MYIGLGFLISGLMMLIWILFETNRRIDPLFEAGLLNIYTPAKPKPYIAAKPASKLKHLQYVEYPLRRTPKVTTITDDRVPKSIVRAYGENTIPNPNLLKMAAKRVKQTISTDDSYRNQMERILNRLRSGRNELEIAQELGIGRDEVAMTLNLSHYRRGKL